MKDFARERESVTERQAAVEVIRTTLKEGESITGGFYMKGGALYAVTTEGWENIDAIIIRLSDAAGGVMRPEIDESAASVYFKSPRNGLYELTIVLSAVADGRESAEVKAVAREVLGHPRKAASKELGK